MSLQRLPLLALFTYSIALTLHADDVIYSHTFDEPSATALNGLTVDSGATTWTASATAKGDGTDSVTSTAWLPYAFGSGIYTVTASIDVSTLPTNSTGLAGITFTNDADFSTGDFISTSNNTYTTFGLRGTSNWDFWAGLRSANAIDGGSTVFPRVNTLKVILDTTKTNWVVTASLLDAGAHEVFVDLNPGDAGSISYTYSTNPNAFTGVGFVLRNTAAKIDSFTFSTASIPEPATASLFVGLFVLTGCALRRHQRA